MEHKAYLFDYNAFDRELSDILFSALLADKTAGLTDFIEKNVTTIKSPYDGKPVVKTWQSLIPVKDAHTLGDFALTKFYDPDDDRGIRDVWLDLPDSLTKRNFLFIGHTFGPADRRFDPGKMGSYFLKPSNLSLTIANLESRKDKEPLIFCKTNIDRYYNLLKEAESAGKGVYITF